MHEGGHEQLKMNTYFCGIRIINYSGQEKHCTIRMTIIVRIYDWLKGQFCEVLIKKAWQCSMKCWHSMIEKKKRGKSIHIFFAFSSMAALWLMCVLLGL